MSLTSSPYATPPPHVRAGQEHIIRGMGGSSSRRQVGSAFARSPSGAIVSSASSSSSSASTSRLASRPSSASTSRVAPSPAKAAALHSQFQPSVYLPLSQQHIFDSPTTGLGKTTRPTSAASAGRRRPSSAAAPHSFSSAVTHASQSSAAAAEPAYATPRDHSVVPAWESTESRLHHLHLQCLHAAQMRHWPELVSLRIEMLALSKLIGGPGSAQVHLARLALADAYARANMFAQAVEHCRALPTEMEKKMGYVQGAFDAHMLLGRAYFGLSRESGTGADAAAAAATSPSNGSASSTAVSSEHARQLDRSLFHFRAALALTQLPFAEFFRHTTIRNARAMRTLAHRKSVEAQLALASTLAATEKGQEEQMNILTGLWDQCDQFATEEKRLELIDAARARGEDTEGIQALEFALNDSPSSIELYFCLGRAFFLRGEDTNAQDNLARALAVARRNPEQTMANALDADLRPTKSKTQSSSSAWGESSETKERTASFSLPDPTLVHYPLVMLVIESSLLLAVSYTRSSMHQDATECFSMAKRMLQNVAAWIPLAAGVYDRPFRPVLPLPDAAPNASLPPPPSHTPIATSSGISHGAIDHGWSSLLQREWGWHFNVFVSFSANKLRDFCAKSILQVNTQLVNILCAQEKYEEAASVQEEICAMVEQQDITTSAEGAGGDAPPSDDSSFTGASTGNLYQFDVAKAHRRLGDIFLLAHQPLSAKAAYKLSLQVLQVMYGIRKIHSVAVKHPRHSGFANGNSVGSPHRPSSASASKRSLLRPGALSGFGSQSVALMRASIAAEHAAAQSSGLGDPATGAEHGVPPHVLKLVQQLKQALALLKERIRTGANGSATSTAADESTAAAATEEENYETNNDSFASADSATSPPDSSTAAGASAGGEDDPFAAHEAGTTDGSIAAAAAAGANDEYAQAFDATPPVSPLPAELTAGRKSKKKKKASSLFDSPSSSNSAIPRSPHVGRVFRSTFDPLSGASPVVAEGLQLRAAMAAPGAEEVAVRRSMYDAYVVEKENALRQQRKMEEKLAAQQAQADANAAAAEASYFASDDTSAPNAEPVDADAEATPPAEPAGTEAEPALSS